MDAVASGGRESNERRCPRRAGGRGRQVRAWGKVGEATSPTHRLVASTCRAQAPVCLCAPTPGCAPTGPGVAPIDLRGQADARDPTRAITNGAGGWKCARELTPSRRRRRRHRHPWPHPSYRGRRRSRDRSPMCRRIAGVGGSMERAAGRGGMGRSWGSVMVCGRG